LQQSFSPPSRGQAFLRLFNAIQNGTRSEWIAPGPGKIPNLKIQIPKNPKQKNSKPAGMADDDQEARGGVS
jgi:hypothetical protein